VNEPLAHQSAPARAGRRSWADLGPRLASAAVLLAITAVSLVVGGYIFAIVVGLVFAGTYREWERMVTLKPLTPVGMGLIVLVGLAPVAYPWLGGFGTMGVVTLAAVIALAADGEAALWRAGGLLFFGAVMVAILALRGTTSDGILAGVFLGLVIWSTDSGAFFTGRQVGGEKLAPDISPGKTWSGAIGGLAIGTLLGLVYWLIFTHSPWWIGLLVSAGLSIVGQVGDLMESAVKRRFRVKDSGDIIPGHGGLMDRLDSVTFGAIAAFLIGGIHGGFDAPAANLMFW
jgi:phosphatidate cytidylyltransferase